MCQVNLLQQMKCWLHFAEDAHFANTNLLSMVQRFFNGLCYIILHKQPRSVNNQGGRSEQKIPEKHRSTSSSAHLWDQTKIGFVQYLLCKDLLENNKWTLVGTLRTNKKEITPVFIDTKRKAAGAVTFGFKNDFTLVSSCPRKARLFFCYPQCTMMLRWTKLQILKPMENQK